MKVLAMFQNTTKHTKEYSVSFHFAEDFVDKACASTLHSLLQILCAHSICVSEILSKYIFPRILLVLILELFPRPIPKLQDKGKQLDRDSKGVKSRSGL